MLYGTVRYT